MGIRLENHNYGRVENVCAWLKDAQARHKLLGEEIAKAKSFVGVHYGWQKTTELLTAKIRGVEIISSLTVVEPYKTWAFDMANMIGEDKSKSGGVDNKCRYGDPRGGVLGEMYNDLNMDMDEFNSFWKPRHVGGSLRLR